MAETSRRVMPQATRQSRSCVSRMGGHLFWRWASNILLFIEECCKWDIKLILYMRLKKNTDSGR